jgi:acetyl-CoA carboxylase biotin carboxyl carrier protein
MEWRLGANEPDGRSPESGEEGKLTRMTPKAEPEKGGAQETSPPLTVKQMADLISKFRDSGVSEFELEYRGMRLKASLGQGQTPALCHRQPSGESSPISIHTTPTAAAVEAAGQSAPVEEAKPGRTVNSPMVGTFYRAPAPEAPPFVDTGSEVIEDTVLCIVEAMKIMNEIKAECRGKVAEVLVENGQPVEYGQPLFRIVPL